MGVLDLDVCEKSLRKRKDDSVHELGSRRSKKRRKLTSKSNASNSNSNSNSVSMLGQSSAYGGISGFYPKQEEYDQFAAQLLFSLSHPPVYPNQDMNQAMDWSMQMNMSQMMSMNQAQQQPMQGMQALPPMPPQPPNANATTNIKSEEMQPIAQTEQELQDQQLQMQQQYAMMVMKPEQHMQYGMADPLYMQMQQQYYSQMQQQPLPTTDDKQQQQAMMTSLSTSTMWDSNGHSMAISEVLPAPISYAKEEKHDMNSDGVLIPKQEPMPYPDPQM